MAATTGAGLRRHQADGAALYRHSMRVLDGVAVVVIHGNPCTILGATLSGVRWG